MDRWTDWQTHTLHKTDLVAISKMQFRGITYLYTPHCLALELSISPDKTPQTALIEDLPCVRCCAGHFTLIGPGSLHQSFEGLAPHTRVELGLCLGLSSSSPWCLMGSRRRSV